MALSFGNSDWWWIETLDGKSKCGAGSHAVFLRTVREGW